MSALGQRRICALTFLRSASRRLADVSCGAPDFRLVPIPDLRAPSVEVSNRSRSVAARRGGVSAGFAGAGKMTSPGENHVCR